MPPHKRKIASIANGTRTNPPPKLQRSERIPVENAPPCNLLDLKDDCLQEILPHLVDDDLCALNHSCSRLKNEDFVRRKKSGESLEFAPTAFVRVSAKVFVVWEVNHKN